MREEKNRDDIESVQRRDTRNIRSLLPTFIVSFVMSLQKILVSFLRGSRGISGD